MLRSSLYNLLMIAFWARYFLIAWRIRVSFAESCDVDFHMAGCVTSADWMLAFLASSRESQ